MALRIDPMRFGDTYPIDVSPLNELLDRIQTMGMSDDQTPAFDRIGLKSDDREIRTPSVTHLVTTVECPTGGLSSQ